MISGFGGFSQKKNALMNVRRWGGPVHAVPGEEEEGAEDQHQHQQTHPLHLRHQQVYKTQQHTVQVYIPPQPSTESLSDDDIALLYVTKLSTISLYLTKLYVT